jgi:hypothetical protein
VAEGLAGSLDRGGLPMSALDSLMQPKVDGEKNAAATTASVNAQADQKPAPATGSMTPANNGMPPEEGGPSGNASSVELQTDERPEGVAYARRSATVRRLPTVEDYVPPGIRMIEWDDAEKEGSEDGNGSSAGSDEDFFTTGNLQSVLVTDADYGHIVALHSLATTA